MEPRKFVFRGAAMRFARENGIIGKPRTYTDLYGMEASPWIVLTRIENGSLQILRKNGMWK